MRLRQILKVALRGGASDVILKTGSIPKFRYGGQLVPLSESKEITTEMFREWLTEILPERFAAKIANLTEVDFAFEWEEGSRMRAALFRQRHNWSLVLRVIPPHIQTLEQLLLPGVLQQFSRERHGLVLLTGATGSGKSTTLAAMVQKINSERSAHIITIEDPIEFIFKDEQATIHQREIGDDTPNFAVALRSALRQNPDVIMVGELRDKDTVETALMAAETGHLVLSSMHTIDAVETLTRILSYFSGEQQQTVRIVLSQVLKGIVSQRLVARSNGKGLTVAAEIMVANGVIRDAIVNGKDFGSVYEAIRMGGDTYGMQSFDDSLLDLVKKGTISREEALRQASVKGDMELRLRGLRS